jgi:prevent-host-death family protein
VSQVATSRSGSPGVVGVRELREDTSAVVAAVERGNWFLVSKRGKPVGVFLPSAMAEELLLEHAAEIVALQLDAGRHRAESIAHSRPTSRATRRASPLTMPRSRLVAPRSGQ